LVRASTGDEIDEKIAIDEEDAEEEIERIQMKQAERTQTKQA
jgi:hypothetical protein